VLSVEGRERECERVWREREKKRGEGVVFRRVVKRRGRERGERGRRKRKRKRFGPGPDLEFFWLCGRTNF